MKTAWLVGVLGVWFCVIVGTGQTLLFSENFELLSPPDLPNNWQILTPPEQGLWKTVSKSDLYSEPSNVRAFPSGNKALYYGYVTAGRGSYHTGAQTQGKVRTPNIPVSGYTHVTVSFWFFRIVESYSPGGFDKTLVRVVFFDGQQTTSHVIFSKDSKDPSSTQWEKFESMPIQVPTNASALYVVFEFDSVDLYKNDYLGWLIDDLEIKTVPAPVAPLTIVTNFLKTGIVGQPYEEYVAAQGGVPPYSWECNIPRELDWLQFDDRTGLLRGIPNAPGTWPLTFTVTDYARNTASKTLYLTISPSGIGVSQTYSHCFSDLENWSTDGLWKIVNQVLYNNVDIAQIPYEPVAYYGQTPSYNYATGSRTSGYLTSPLIGLSLTDEGRALAIEFSHWREVEFYDKGSYDRTFIQVQFYSSNQVPITGWFTLWESDSRTPSERSWQSVYTITEVKVPKNASSMKIRFGFDSVDSVANNFVGWLIRCVNVYLVDVAPLKIVSTCPCRGALRENYSFELKAEGGTKPYAWDVSGLPTGLTVNRDSGIISGIPQEAGNFPLTITVTDAAGSKAYQYCTLIISDEALLFFEAFSAAPSSWSKDGLWMFTDRVVYAGQDIIEPGSNYAAYYGQTTSYNYSTTSRTVGTLTSPEIPLAGAKYIRISFDYWREVEHYPAGSYDKTYVEVQFGNGPWIILWYKDSQYPSEKAWTSYLSGGIEVPTGAATLKIRFVFDSVDRFYNNYVGWLIDNVKVVRTASGVPLAPLSLPVADPRDLKISVFNVPNPVRDVHTTTFVVRGVEADLIKVEVYDLTGRLVYVGQALGNELVWHTQDLLGRYLANGVYLYKVYVKVGDTWIVSDTQKIVILR